MKGDFTRSTFRPREHYSSVRMQQGRVQLDADWNEQSDIAAHRVETEAVDVIGRCGAPKHNPGFGIITDVTAPTPEQQALLDNLAPGDFLVGKGRYYVDGIMCENEDDIAFTAQPDMPGTQPVLEAGVYAAYLDVWRRHITTIEDPSIREVALGGPDTATRAKTVWQIKLALLEGGEKATCSDDIEPWLKNGTGKLSARAEPPASSQGPCVVAPGAGYRRLENQLYRVEIHRGSLDPEGPTYKWSRDNGSVVVPVEQFNYSGDAAKVRVRSLGRDRVLGLNIGDWVEVLDDAAELHGDPGTLLQIDDIDAEQRVLILSGPVPASDMGLHPKVRRWDSKQEFKVSDATSDFVELEDGVQIKFEPGDFNTGDYWTIPARTVPGKFGDVEWPRDGANNPIPQPQQGIIHHFCKVALVTFAGGEDDIEITKVEDCRPIFPPLTELPHAGASCCTVTVGEGGDFKDIQEAINSAEDGSKVCILPGTYNLRDTVVISERLDLTVSGCGRQTRIIGPPGKTAFAIVDQSKGVTLQSLSITTSAKEPSILMSEALSPSVLNCFVANQTSASTGAPETAPLIDATDCNQVSIKQNELLQNRWMYAIRMRAAHSVVEGNAIRGGGILLRYGSIDVVIRDNEITIPGDGINREPGPGIQLGLIEEQPLPLPIAQVQILDNSITRMGGSGITTAIDAKLETLRSCDNLVIARNRITHNLESPPKDVFIQETTVAGGIVLAVTSQVRIYDNLIAYNGSRSAPACGVFAWDCDSLDIDRNSILDNGAINPPADSRAFQAGILAMFVVGHNESDSLMEFLSKQGGANPEIFSAQQTGIPALRVHDNVVTCPEGHALIASALGSVSVADNTLTSRSYRAQPFNQGLNILNFGACVVIVNFGAPEFRAEGAAGITWENILAGSDDEALKEIRLLPGGRVKFHDNQVTLTGAIPVLGSMDFAGRGPADFGPACVHLISVDDISLQDNQVRSIINGPAMIAGTSAQGMTVRASGNRFAEFPNTAFASYRSLAPGMNLTVGNEATHSIFANGLVINNLSLNAI
ncbi:MAG TPA: DUF6519 domain-containing protein [Blastocatellia bacterium]|nr:DUF6519 domain-containing protein [Blastocatellia bacterium]